MERVPIWCCVCVSNNVRLISSRDSSTRVYTSVNLDAVKQNVHYQQYNHVIDAVRYYRTEPVTYML